jgi:hypothetical protein
MTDQPTRASKLPHTVAAGIAWYPPLFLSGLSPELVAKPYFSPAVRSWTTAEIDLDTPAMLVQSYRSFETQPEPDLALQRLKRQSEHSSFF